MSQPRDDRQDDLFRPLLEEIINLRHPLVRLAGEIDWDFLAGRFSSVCRVGYQKSGDMSLANIKADSSDADRMGIPPIQLERNLL